MIKVEDRELQASVAVFLHGKDSIVIAKRGDSTATVPLWMIVKAVKEIDALGKVEGYLLQNVAKGKAVA
jgi:uncharacterized radical SAM superfamily protein